VASKGKAETSTSIVGSATASKTFRGALAASVSAAGKVTLTRSGKAVTSLKTGRYALTVTDRSRSAGFTLKALHGKPVAVTTGAFTGSKKVTLGLAPGRWYFFSPGGTQSQFFILS
jgi:sarcosine oxidase gamma subunit